MNVRKSVAFVGLAAALGLVAAAVPWSSPEAAGAPEQDDTKRVTVAVATDARGTSELRFSGIVRAHRRSDLAFVVSGRVRSRPVEVGDRVEAGQPLAYLDRAGSANSVALAHAELQRAEELLSQRNRDRERSDRLVAEQAISAVEAEQAEHAVSVQSSGRQAASVSLREARRIHRESVLRAPYDGEVVAAAADTGEFVSPGQSVVTIAGDVLEVEVQVPETVLAELAEGDIANLRLPLQGDQALQGSIVSIAHGGDGPGRLFPIRIALPGDRGLIPGMTVDFALQRDSEPGMRIPVASVLETGGGATSVFVLDEDVVRRRAVEVASLLGEGAIVTSGLRPGERVVVGGHFGLVDGQAVEVAP